MAALAGYLLEDYIPVVLYNGIKTNQNITIGGTSAFDASGSTGVFKTSTGVNTFGGSSNVFTNGITIGGGLIGQQEPVTASGGATRLLTAVNSGSMNLFDAATGVVYTLPTPVVGVWYDFVCSVTITSGTAEVDTSSGSVFILGSVINLKTDGTVLACFANGTSTVKIASNGSTTGGLKGGQFRMTCISSTVWQITGNVQGSSTIATPFA